MDKSRDPKYIPKINKNNILSLQKINSYTLILIKLSVELVILVIDIFIILVKLDSISKSYFLHIKIFDAYFP